MNDKKTLVDQDVIRELARLLTETGLTEIEIDRDKTRIRVVRAPGPTAAAAAVALPQAAPAPAVVNTAAPATASRPATHAGAILSPMVGTAFRSPEPGAKPYVEVGDRVREGQTLLIIEAMKTMNQIPAPRAGRITQIIVSDGQPVEFGEPLMIIE